ncbi:MAG: acyl-ACP--UDP-N-acetylglucosamine O-acyltransferase [Nibricoccus sp.]
MATTIHPTAIIERDAQLGLDCDLHAGAIIRRHTILGDHVTVHPYAVVGGDPQDLRFDRKSESGVRIGNGTTIREHVTINRSTKIGGFTDIGENCFIMANVHVAHDCVIGKNVVVANNVMLAGHVSVGDHTFFGGGVGVHQFCRIGEGVMVAGNAAITRDVPHYVMVAERDDVIGLNLIGLKRRGVSRDAIVELKHAFHEVYFTVGNIRTIAAAALESGRFGSAEVKNFLGFFAGGKRSFARARRSAVKDAGGE